MMQLQRRKKQSKLCLSIKALYIRDSRALIDNFYAWCNMYTSGDLQGASPRSFPMTCSRLSKKATESLNTGLKVTPDALMKAVIFFYCSNTQHRFYKVSCLKIISSSDCIFKTLHWHWRAATEHLLHQFIPIFFACHCDTICYYQRQSFLSQLLFLFQLAVKFPRWMVGYKGLQQTSVPQMQIHEIHTEAAMLMLYSWSARIFSCVVELNSRGKWCRDVVAACSTKAPK